MQELLREGVLEDRGRPGTPILWAGEVPVPVRRKELPPRDKLLRWLRDPLTGDAAGWVSTEEAARVALERGWFSSTQSTTCALISLVLRGEAAARDGDRWWRARGVRP